jgi:thioesterase domain-containing protein
VLIFNDLARRLGTDQPFYGLQAQGLEGQQPRHTRIEDMATCYLNEIRAVQPDGPYFLGGYCFGGRVAFEMAQQLHAQGKRVALLAMIDSYAPGYLKLLPWIERKVRQRFAYHWGNLARLGLRERLDYFLEKGKVVRVRMGTRIRNIVSEAYLGVGIPLPSALQQVHQQKRLVSEYVPRIYPGKITVFSPTKGAESYYHDLHMGWGRFAAEGLEIHAIPGSFSRIVLEPCVGELAERLAKCIEKAQTEP